MNKFERRYVKILLEKIKGAENYTKMCGYCDMISEVMDLDADINKNRGSKWDKKKS